MKVICPCCKAEFDYTPSGHPPKLELGVITLCNSLSMCKSITQAAKKLNCSRSYIYQELKKIGKNPKDYLRGGVDD
jgi:hypothetical protein